MDDEFDVSNVEGFRSSEVEITHAAIIAHGKMQSFLKLIMMMFSKRDELQRECFPKSVS